MKLWRSLTRAAGSRAAAWFGALIVFGCISGFASQYTPAGAGAPDSGIYLDGARHLAAGNGFRTSLVPIGGEPTRPIAIHPPGYSALMAIGIAVGFDALESAGRVASTSFALFALSVYAIVIFSAGSRWWPAGAALAVVLGLSSATLRALTVALSDLPFAALTGISATLALAVAARTRPQPVVLAALGASVALCALTRWAGLFFAAGILAGVLVGGGSTWTPRERVRRGLWVAAPTLVVTAAWMLRNLSLGAAPFGSRPLQPTPIGETLARSLQGATVEFFGGPPAAIWGLAALVAVSVAAAWTHALATPQRRAARVLSTIAGTYATLVIVGVLVTDLRPASISRYWLPLWPLLAALPVAAASGSARPFLRATVTAILIVSVGGLAMGIQGRLGPATVHANSKKIFVNPAIAGSVPVRLALEHGGACNILSNAPTALLFYGAFERIHFLPTSFGAMAPLLEKEQNLCVAWFTGVGGPSVNSRRRAQGEVLRELAETERLRPLARDEAGAFWVSDADALQQRRIGSKIH